MNQTIINIIFALAVSLFCQPLLAGAPIESKEGALAVETSDDLSVKDAVRNKDLSYKVYYPKTGGPYPVILFSHGFGGNKDAFSPISKHWASHGYVVIHPTHADGLGRQKVERKSSGDDKTAARGRFSGLMSGLNDPEKINDRVADLVLLLDNLDNLPKTVPGLTGKIDSTCVGVAGHSFGAYTTMLIGGVTADLGAEKGKSFYDKRVKCILPISGQGTGQQGLTSKSWEALKLPMMTITGTRDQGVGGQGVDWKKEPFNYSPAGDKYLVVIEGANHLSFGGGLGLRTTDITDVVKLCSTVYWNAYLKKLEVAKKYLQPDALVKDSDSKCTFEKK
jgi:predicted dienelactone hydrolase